MKNVIVLLVLMVCMLGLSACSSTYADAHKGVFGCDPVGYERPRTLDAEGPKDETPRDMFGRECGKPIYEGPHCPECIP